MFLAASMGLLGVAAVLAWSAADHADRLAVLDLLASHGVLTAVVARVVASVLPWVEGLAAIACVLVVAFSFPGDAAIALAITLLLLLYAGYLALVVARTGAGSVDCGCGPISAALSWPIALRPAGMALLALGVALWKPAGEAQLALALQVFLVWTAVLALHTARSVERRWREYAEHAYRLMLVES